MASIRHGIAPIQVLRSPPSDTAHRDEARLPVFKFPPFGASPASGETAGQRYGPPPCAGSPGTQPGPAVAPPGAVVALGAPDRTVPPMAGHPGHIRTLTAARDQPDGAHPPAHRRGDGRRAAVRRANSVM